MKLFAIETGNFKLDGGAMFGVIPKVMWQRVYPADENNLCNWAMRALLIDDGARKILIDNGLGDKLSPSFLRHYYLNGEATLLSSLAKNGYQPEDITDVIITHLHFDHCGGNTRLNEAGEVVATFKNAMYHVSKTQWDWALNPTNREKPSLMEDNFMPLYKNNQLNFVENEGEILPKIFVKFFNGHTEGQLIPYIYIEPNKLLVYGADLMPAAAHVPLSWVMAYDVRPLQTFADKERLYSDLLPLNSAIFFEHDIYNECCSIEKTEKGVKVKKTFTLNDFVNSI